MPFSFYCRTCQQTHEGLPSFGPDAPDSYAMLTPEDQASRAVDDGIRPLVVLHEADHPLYRD